MDEDVEQGGGEAVVAEVADSPEAAPLSDDQAFDAAAKEARAELAEKPADSPDEGEAVEEPKKPAAKPYSAMGEADRLLTLAQQNRLHELPPEARGVADKLREHWIAEVRAEQAAAEQAKADEASFHEMYLGMLAEQVEDPDAFAQRLIEEPDYAAFMKQYRTDHPDVSVDNPTPEPRTPSEDDVRKVVVSEFATATIQTLATLATDAGIDEATFQRFSDEAQGRVGTLMAKVMQEGASKLAAKEIEKIRKVEREAAAKEAQAKYANKTIVVPKPLGGQWKPSEPQKALSGTHSWETALVVSKAN